MKKHLWTVALIALMLALCCTLALADGNHTVTLALNGSTGASQTVTVNSRTLMTVQAPGATALRILDPNRWHPGDGEIETADCWDYYDDRGWNTEYLETYQIFDSGAGYVYAEARYDDHQGNIRDWNGEGDSPWTGVSQTINLTLTNNGQSLAAPSVTMSSSGSVTRGDWLTLSINNPQGKGEWYWADLDRVYGEDRTDFLSHFDFSSSYEVAIHTAKYEAGTYRLRIYASAAGYANHSLTEKEFTITGSGSTNAFLKVNKENLTVGEDVFISAFAPSENEVRIEITKQGDPSWFERREWGGPYAQNRWNADQPGTYVLSLIVNGQAADSKTVTFATLSGNERLSKPDLSGMPAMVTKGQAYSGIFTVDNHAERIDINVNYMPDQGNWIKVYQSNREKTDANYTSLNLPADMISRVGRYKVDVHTCALGHEDSNTGFVFLVKEAESGTQMLTLTVNGSTDDIESWQSSTDVHIQVQGSGATAIRLLRDENWEDVEGWTSGTVHWNKGFGVGDHILIAQMTTDDPVWRSDNFDWSNFNWNNLHWTTLSNPVKIHVTSQGRLAEPQVTLKVGSNTLDPQNATVTQGDVLTVTAAQHDHAEWIQGEFRILRINDGSRWWDGIQNGHFDSNGQDLTMQIPTAGIPAGNYYLQVGVDAVNWEGSYVYIPLTVVEPEGGVEPGLVFSRESMQTNEGISIMAWAPGARRMELDISMEGDPNWRDGRDTDRDSTSWSWGCGLGGTYTFTLKYFMPGENDPQTITKKLTVISNGVMSQPVLSGIPDLLYLGNGIQGSFTAVSGTEWYNVGVRYSYNGYNWDDIVNENRDPNQEGVTSLNFDKNIFDQEGIYRIWVSANAVGKDNGCTERQIQVIDSSNIDENLVLRVNGQTDGAQVHEVYLHMEPEVSVSAPSGVTAVRMINSTSNWEYRLPDQNGMAYCNLGVHQGGYVVFRAQATTDTAVTQWANGHDGDMYGFDWNSVNWSMSSLPVTVNVIYLGDLDDPEVTFKSSTVERGDMLEFTISPVEHSDYYGYRIRKVLENGLSDYILDNDLGMTEATTIQVPTDAMTAGTYRLDVDPRRYGWQGNESSHTFTVTETTPSTTAVFTTKKNTVLTQETMYFSIYAPGADRVKLCHENEAIVWAETQGEAMVRMVIPNRVRTYHVMAYALYPNSNQWTKIGDTLEITVTAPNGTLPSPIITAPKSVLKGEDGALIVMLNCDYLETYGSAECWLSSQENEGEEYQLEQFGEQRNPDGTYTEIFRLDTGRLKPGTYTIEAFAFPGAPGYAMGQSTATVTVTQNSGIQATLTANKQVLEIFEDVHVSVDAGSSATAIALYANGEWIYETGASLVDDETAWWEGEMTFFAYYSTAALPNNDSWRNPAWTGWTGVSNIVTVPINPPTQELNLEFTVAKTTVQQGEKFKVIITNNNTNLNPSYGATLQRLEESGQFGSSNPWYAPEEGSNIILVDTRNMQPGDYVLHITANAVACRGVLEDVNVHITEAVEAVGTLILPSGLTVIEEEAFAGVAAGKIIVPEGVTTIKARAFANCPNLEEIVLPAGIGSFAGNAFDGCAHQVKTYGSAGSYLAGYAANVDNLVFVPEE